MFSFFLRHIPHPWDRSPLFALSVSPFKANKFFWVRYRAPQQVMSLGKKSGGHSTVAWTPCLMFTGEKEAISALTGKPLGRSPFVPSADFSRRFRGPPIHRRLTRSQAEEHRRGKRHSGSLQAARASIVPSAASAPSPTFGRTGHGASASSTTAVNRCTGHVASLSSVAASGGAGRDDCGDDTASALPTTVNGGAGRDRCNRNGGASCPRINVNQSSFAEEESSAAEAGPRVPVGCARLRRPEHAPEDVLTPPSSGPSGERVEGGTSTTQVL